MTIKDFSLLNRCARYIDELIEAGRKLGPMYRENPQLVPDITRKAKWLRTALEKFQDFLKERTEVDKTLNTKS